MALENVLVLQTVRPTYEVAGTAGHCGQLAGSIPLVLSLLLLQSGCVGGGGLRWGREACLKANCPESPPPDEAAGSLCPKSTVVAGRERADLRTVFQAVNSASSV